VREPQDHEYQSQRNKTDRPPQPEPSAECPSPRQAILCNASPLNFRHDPRRQQDHAHARQEGNDSNYRATVVRPPPVHYGVRNCARRVSHRENERKINQQPPAGAKAIRSFEDFVANSSKSFQLKVVS
jgi:hypothetical protein